MYVYLIYIVKSSKSDIKNQKSFKDNGVIADIRIFLSGWLVHTSSQNFVNLYPIPFLTKFYDYIFQSMSSSSLRPILLNFVKTMFF